MRTGGRCMPCVQKEADDERRRFVEANRVDVDRFAGVTDPVRRIELVHERPPRDPVVRDVPPSETLPEMVAKLDARGIQRLIDSTVHALAEERQRGHALARTLACLTRADLRDVQLALVRARDPYPSVVFRDASEVPTTALAALLDARDIDALLASHALSALAWTHNPRAVELFSRWRQHPPPWAGLLHISPDHYAHAGGWELSEVGTPRALCGEPCMELVAYGSSGDARAIVATEQRCRCGRTLTLLFDVQTARTNLPWLGWPCDRLVVPTCDACACFGTLFHSVNEDDVLTPIGEHPLVPDDAASWPLLPSVGLRLGAPRSPYFAADWLLEMKQSQLGGHPGWIQDPAYPQCPKCARTMCFVGQVACGDVEPNREGTYYGYACAPCRVVASNYQQT
jgi:hypothetical protein